MSETIVYCDESGRLNRYSNITDIYTTIKVDKSCKILTKTSLSYSWVTSIKLPSTLISILDDPFFGAKITELFIPASVIEIDDLNPFNHLRYIERYIVDSYNKNYTSYQDCIFTKDMSKLIAYPYLKSGDTFIVPKDTKIIGKQIFHENSKIKNIIFQNNVELLDESCFHTMPNLIRISLPYGCSVKKLCPDVFVNTNFDASKITYYFGNPNMKCNTKCEYDPYVFTFKFETVFICFFLE